MLQAPGFEGLSLNLLSMSQNGFVTPEVDVGGCDVVQALTVAWSAPTEWSSRNVSAWTAFALVV